jgi:polar amino acid transport system permease protein
MELNVIIGMLGKGFLITLRIFIFTLIISLPLGLVVAYGRMSKNLILRNLFKLYISVMRGTPLMLQLFMVYFGPFFIFKANISGNYRFIAVVIAFGLNYAAYFAEIYRGGFDSMPKGQYEASKVLGYSKLQTFWRIILPQVIKRIMPSITNEVITLVKDTSLAFVISVSEMFTAAKAVASSQASMTPYLLAGIIYYIFNYLVAFIMEQFESKMSYYD